MTTLPPEIGLLLNTRVGGLKVDNNPLKSPPAEIVKQGTEAILAYLQAQLQRNRKKTSTLGSETKSFSWKIFEILVGIATIIAAIAAVLALFI